MANGRGEFVGEFEGFEKRVEEVREFVGVGFARAEVGFESGEGETVDGVDFGVADVFISYAFLEFVADLGVEGHEGAASLGEVMIDGDQHLDDGEGFTRAGDGFDDEVAVGLVGPEDGGRLLRGHGGTGDRKGLRGGRKGRGKGDVHWGRNEVIVFFFCWILFHSTGSQVHSLFLRSSCLFSVAILIAWFKLVASG